MSGFGTSRQISSREFTVGIGWKADIGRQVVSAKPVAIDPLRNSLVQCHHTFRVHHGGTSRLADLSEFGYPVPYEPSTHFQTWVSQESMRCCRRWRCRRRSRRWHRPRGPGCRPAATPRPSSSALGARRSPLWGDAPKVSGHVPMGAGLGCRRTPRRDGRVGTRSGHANRAPRSLRLPVTD